MFGCENIFLSLVLHIKNFKKKKKVSDLAIGVGNMVVRHQLHGRWLWLLDYQLWPLDWWPSHQIRGESHDVCFVKCFYQVFKSKIFYNFLQKSLQLMENIFKFNKVLQWNKYRKMLKLFFVKYFTVKQIVR